MVKHGNLFLAFAPAAGIAGVRAQESTGGRPIDAQRAVRSAEALSAADRLSDACAARMKNKADKHIIYSTRL
jgi:hypothetical protein